MDNQVYDIVGLGETLLRLTPPKLERLDQSAGFDVQVGGCESNTLSAMARLGFSCAWLSRLPESELGDRVRQTLRQHNVDVQHVCPGGDDRMGLYFYEPGRAPHLSQVIYDRADSAMARMTPADLPTALFQPGRARLFHTSGITLGLSASASATAQQALKLARSAGIPCSLDINFRQRLWSARQARQCLEPLLGQLELLLVAERDIQALWPEAWDASSPEATLRRFQGFAPNSLLVMTRGSAGATLLTPAGELYRVDAFVAREVERLGGGDAFAAGFLSAWLEGKDYPQALRQGAAVAAFKYATPGDIAWINRRQLERLLADPAATELCR
ncbi:sugar kinase [Marinobacterium rhizophilum]|uniref:Sugar kinase n=1 Tax=Marinobacterium rhizophilum TaxID=420402 RepID=A0ABY5HHK8_9GAMM|nr:sugar kinase [Marinobacterium rhizophilum]UTW11317.1 sugar kinase [Marinobacterium rhizophilum]